MCSGRACPLGAGGGDGALIAVEQRERDHGSRRDVVKDPSDAGQRSVCGKASLCKPRVHPHVAPEQADIEAADIFGSRDFGLCDIDAVGRLTHIGSLLGGLGKGQARWG